MSVPCETDVERWSRGAMASWLYRYGLARMPIPMNSDPSRTRMTPMARRMFVPSTVKSLEPTNE
jgi:hypothetical protein